MQTDGEKHELQIKDKSGISVEYGLQGKALIIELTSAIEKEGSEISELIVITSSKWTVKTVKTEQS